MRVGGDEKKMSKKQILKRKRVVFIIIASKTQAVKEKNFFISLNIHEFFSYDIHI